MKKERIRILKINNEIFSPALVRISLAVFLLLAVTINTMAQNESQPILKADANRTVKTLTGSQFVYTLFLENTDAVSHNYLITGKNQNENCLNPDGMSSETNIDLNISVEDPGKNPITDSVTVAPGETFQFFVKLEVPDNTAYNAWNCTVITVDAEDCSPATLLLHTFYPNPENLE